MVKALEHRVFKTKQLRSVLVKLLVLNECLNGRGFSCLQLIQKKYHTKVQLTRRIRLESVIFIEKFNPSPIINFGNPLDPVIGVDD